MRFLSSFCCVAGLLGGVLWPLVGRAEEESKVVCASAFADAQRSIRSGRFLRAKKNLELCGGPRCPQVMHSECQNLLLTVEVSLSTVLFNVTLEGARAIDGEPAHDVQVAVDGAEPVPFDGKAIALDPGAHDFVFTANGFQPASKHMVVTEGEMLRREQVSLAPSLFGPMIETSSPWDEVPVRAPEGPSPAPASSQAKPGGLLAFGPAQAASGSAPRSKSLTVPLIISSSVTVLAGASAVFFGVNARNDDRALDSCAPTLSCSTYDVNRVRREYLWTNISIGAAVVGLAASATFYLLDRHYSKKAGPHKRPVGLLTGDL
jgi:hypothetical protein